MLPLFFLIPAPYQEIGDVDHTRSQSNQRKKNPAGASAVTDLRQEIARSHLDEEARGQS